MQNRRSNRTTPLGEPKKGIHPRQARRDNTHAARQQQVADLYLQGATQMEVASRLGMHQSEVSRLLKAMREEWKVSAVLDLSDRITQETIKLDRLERAAHLAYVKSCLPSWRGVGVMPEKLSPAKQKKWIADRNKERAVLIEGLLAIPLWELIVKDEARCGDNNLLKTLLSIIDRRIRLWGADAPTKTMLSSDPENPIQVQHTTKTDTEWGSMTTEEKVRYLQDVVKNRASQRKAGASAVTASESN